MSRLDILEDHIRGNRFKGAVPCANLFKIEKEYGPTGCSLICKRCPLDTIDKYTQTLRPIREVSNAVKTNSTNV